MQREKLVLVTDFSSLRAGMLVVIRASSEQRTAATARGISYCGKGCTQHRFMLIGTKPHSTGHGFYCAPDLPCEAPGALLTRNHVDLRMVWRVLDGLEDETAISATRKAEPVGDDLVRRSARGLHPLGAWRR